MKILKDSILMNSIIKIKSLVMLMVIICPTIKLNAQELNCKVKISHTQVQGTNTSVFETLENAINEFMNNRAWTNTNYSQNEKIECIMNITVKQYSEAENRFVGDLLFQLIRPVYNSTYSTTVFSMRDESFNFNYKEYDPLEFNETSMNDNLTAMLAFYAYLFIGLDMDTFSPLGGTEVLQKAINIVDNAQSLGDGGWKAFGNDRNRNAIINDYMENSMEPLRDFMYKYHRLGLDMMSEDTEAARKTITESIELLNAAHANKSLSMLPQIFTDFKRDEIVNIYKGHGEADEKTKVYTILSNLNASQHAEWNKIKK